MGRWALLLMVVASGCGNTGGRASCPDPSENLTLESLTISDSGPVEFTPDSGEYEATVFQPEVRITATPTNKSFTVTVNGVAAKSGEPFFVDVRAGDVDVAIEVTSTCGTTQGYVVKLHTRAPWRRTLPLDERASVVALSADGMTMALGLNASVQIYTRDAHDWVLQQQLADGVAAASLALDATGDTLAIGAPWNSPSDSYPGALYVFARTGTTWSQQAVLQPTDVFAFNLGASVALSANGNLLVGGAVCENTTESEAGVVHTYTRSGTEWTESSPLPAPVPRSGGFFGWSTSLSADGETLAVGQDDFWTSDNTGGVHLFHRDAGAWDFAQSLLPSECDGGECTFGHEVALSSDGRVLIVAAPTATSEGSTSLSRSDGAAYVFEVSADGWTQSQHLKAPTLRQSFGNSVAVDQSGQSFAVSSGVGVSTFVRADAGWELRDFAEGGTERNALAISDTGTRIVAASNPVLIIDW